jgi:hypothetical protein
LTLFSLPAGGVIDLFVREESVLRCFVLLWDLRDCNPSVKRGLTVVRKPTKKLCTKEWYRERSAIQYRLLFVCKMIAGVYI